MTGSSICHCVGCYPAGTQLISAPTAGKGKRRIMGPIRWGVIMVLVGKPAVAGVRIPCAPSPPTRLPTIVNAPATPVDPEEMAQHTLSEELVEAQQLQITALLTEYEDIFAAGDTTGRTNIVTHQIETGEAAPIKQRPHRMTAEGHQQIREAVQKMLEARQVQPSDSSWGANPVIVKKKDGTARVCIDYRALNEVTRKDCYPLPRTDVVLGELGKAQWFSKLDLKSGYWQIVLDPEDRHKTAFLTQDGLFEFLVMPFGLTSAPATFQRLMDTVLAGLLWKQVMVYLDDIIVYSETWDEHIAALDEVLRRLRAAGLKASPIKCEFGTTCMQYLGHMVTRDRVMPDQTIFAAISECLPPTSVTDVRSFMGMVQYYKEYISDLAGLAGPSYALTRKGAQLTWSPLCQKCYDTLKDRLDAGAEAARPHSPIHFAN